MPLPEVACAQCGTSFAPRRKDGRYCSRPCLKRAGRNSATRTCSTDDCDRAVRARGLCPMHYRRWEREHGKAPGPQWDERRRAAWKARYAKTRGAPDAEAFDYREVYDRDGWVCGICHEPVDPDLSWPDPLSVSLDHIIPVSQGGRHARENAQCSHLRCNVSKGASA